MAARLEHRQVSVSSLCIAAGVPATTALRWINVLEKAGMLQRTADARDKRRMFVELTDSAADRFYAYISATRSKSLDIL
jgi:DNA-binding MarR family transcriptional regulator